MALKQAQQTVLLAHGDIFVRHAVAEYLRSCGKRVIEAASTDEAVAVLARLKVDALLADEATPGTRSVSDLVSLASSREPKPSIIEITACTESVASTAAELCGDSGAALRASYQ